MNTLNCSHTCLKRIYSSVKTSVHFGAPNRVRRGLWTWPSTTVDRFGGLSDQSSREDVFRAATSWRIGLVRWHTGPLDKLNGRLCSNISSDVAVAWCTTTRSSASDRSRRSPNADSVRRSGGAPGRHSRPPDRQSRVFGAPPNNA